MMPYEYDQLTSEFVMKWFLYPQVPVGAPVIPASLVDNDLIRMKDVKQNLYIDAVTFMEMGPGRFVDASYSTLVQKFSNDVTVEEWNDGKRHEYTIEAMKGWLAEARALGSSNTITTTEKMISPSGCSFGAA
jgi:hypothetical protein